MFRHLLSNQTRGNMSWTLKKAKDLDFITLQKYPLDFKKRPGNTADKFLEYHYSQLFIELFQLIRKIFAGDGNLTSSQSPWVHYYTNEFYEHVKSTARPDPHAKHWEGLLRNEAERIFLVTGIIMRVLDTNVFSSLMFGASDKHEKALKAYDIDLINCEGFERSQLLAKMNAAYLHESDGVPPLFWERASRITSQTAAMLLPLYNVVGEESTNSLPTMQEFIQGLGDVVSYAGWLGVMTRLTTGITEIAWELPGDDYQLGQVNLMHEVFEHSRFKADNYDQRQENAPLVRMGRVKISVAPRIHYYVLGDQQAGADPRMHHGYKVLQPHVVYYYGISNSRDDANALFPLSEYIYRVRKPRGVPPMPLVLTVGTIILSCLCYLVIRLSRG